QDNGSTANGGANLDPTPNTATIDVAAINDAPSGTDGSIGVLDHVPYTFTFAEFGFSDPNDTPPNRFMNVLITSVPAVGTLKLGNTTLTPGVFISTSVTNLTYTPAATAFTTQP